jgi:hypothetical protein
MSTTNKPIGKELRAALLPTPEPLLGDDAPLADQVLQLIKLLTEERERFIAENDDLREQNDLLKVALLGFASRQFPH